VSEHIVGDLILDGIGNEKVNLYGGNYGSVLGFGGGRYTDFETYNYGSGWVARMRLEQDGKLGIGTSQPSAKLHVTGPVKFSRGLHVYNELLTHIVYTIGDSQTARGLFQNRLTELLGSCWATDNKGIPGNTASQMSARFSAEVLQAMDAEYVVIWGGVNDIIQHPSITVSEIETSLQSMFTAAHCAGIKVISVSIPPFKGYALWTSAMQSTADEVNFWIASTATNIDFKIDAYSLLEDPNAPDQLASAFDSGDHLHLSVAGYNAVAEAIHSGTTWQGADQPATTMEVSGLVSIIAKGSGVSQGLKVRRSIVENQWLSINYEGGGLNINAVNSSGTGVSFAINFSNDGVTLASTPFSIDGSGNVTIPSLSGSGTRNVTVDANGVLHAQ